MDLGDLPIPRAEDKVKTLNAELLAVSSSSTLSVPVITDNNKKFTLCELILIMDQSCIKTEDLLHFRLVSKSWRDASTSVLLKRNACRITLRKQRLRVTSREDTSYKTFASYNLRYKNTHKVLDDLTSLISTSPQFPVSHFGIFGHRSRNNKFHRYNDHSELHRFLLLYGGQVKILRLENSVSVQELDLYSTFLGKLECLELENAFLYKNKFEQNNTQKPALNNLPHFQSITTVRIIYIGHHKRINSTQLMRLILNSASKLKFIETVDLVTLPVILQNGKGHLITKFTFDYDNEIRYNTTKKILRKIQNFSQICSVPGWHSSMSKLKLDVVDMESEACTEIVNSINAIIRACKDTLENLEITFAPLMFIKPIIIPPLTNIKRLYLNVWDYGSEKDVQDGHVFRFQNESNSDEENSSLSLQTMFPKLCKVCLRLNDNKKYNRSTTFLQFFKMAHSENGTSLSFGAEPECIPSVNSLETNFACLNLTDAEAISTLFPNVKTFKIRPHYTHVFHNTLWTMCPAAESVEICEISWNNYYGAEVKMVDQFLTGFPFEICEKMRNFERDNSPGFLDEFQLLTFLKMLPSICDMPKLRKLKLKFTELSSQFGSDVSGVYALHKMPHLIIVVSYDPNRIQVVEGPGQDPVAVGDGYLASIAPYAQIVHEEQY